MQIIIFLIEILVIFYFLEIDKLKKREIPKEKIYNFDISINENGEELLILTKVPEENKIIIWQNSTIKNEIIDLYFPNMEEIYNQIDKRVIDNGEFKNRLLEYIDYIQGEFLSGNISQQELKKFLLELKPLQPKENKTFNSI